MSCVKEFHIETLKDHTLVLQVEHDLVQIFRLKDPKYGRLQGCLILFTTEGIVIMGDLTPCQNGVISCKGYGLSWFAGQLSEDYLCEKFLSKEFRIDKAIRVFKEDLLRKRRESGLNPPASLVRQKRCIDKDGAREAWNWINGFEDEPNPWAFFEMYSDVFGDTPEGTYGYNLGDAGWLCAIQQTFARLYNQMLEQKEASNAA